MPRQHTLSREGEIQRIEPKAMELLVYFAEHQGEVPTREDLITNLSRFSDLGVFASNTSIQFKARNCGNKFFGKWFQDSIFNQRLVAILLILSEQRTTYNATNFFLKDNAGHASNPNCQTVKQSNAQARDRYKIAMGLPE